MGAPRAAPHVPDQQKSRGILVGGKDAVSNTLEPTSENVGSREDVDTDEGNGGAAMIRWGVRGGERGKARRPQDEPLICPCSPAWIQN